MALLFLICHFRNEKGTGAEMYPTIVSELVTENAPASGHFSRPVSVTESNSTQFLLVSKKWLVYRLECVLGVFVTCVIGTLRS